MYKPAPPRPKKTNIVRARTGCKGCRKRRTKCDEQKPSCGTCTRLKRPCEPVSPRLHFRNSTASSTSIHRQDGKLGSSRGADALDRRIGSYEDSLEWDLRTSGYSTDRTINPAVERTVCFPDRISTGQISSALETSTPFTPFDAGPHFPELHDEDRRAVIPPAILPCRDPTQITLFYMDAWRKQCIPGLNLAFQQLETHPGPTIPTDIKLALSACRLSRVLPQRKISSTSAIESLRFRPDAGHESVSHEHYGTVMRRMARWSRHDFDVNPSLGLAVLVLFCYLESSMGNFREFRIHSEGTKRLMHTYSDWVVCRGGGLLAAWVEVEMQNWWRRVYFSTQDFYRNHGTLSLPTPLEGILSTGDHPRAAVLLILCESHRLSNAAIVSAWDICGSEDSRLTADDTSLLGTAEARRRERGLSVGEYAALLRMQSKKLDDWFSLLPVSDRPAEWQDTEGNLGLDGANIVQPLRFNTHISAMNFAYYATAKVLQYTSVLESLQTSPEVDLDSAYEETEAWISTLLRIAAGLNWKECLRLNVFTVGFTSLLLACALRSRRLATGIWIQGWLEQCLKGNNFEEGNFPVFQILETVRLVNRERVGGMDVLALFQTVDDGGGTGKLGSYHSQTLLSLCVYGRCRTTGQFYTYRRTLFG